MIVGVVCQNRMADDDSWLYGEDNEEEEAVPDEAEVVKGNQNIVTFDIIE